MNPTLVNTHMWIQCILPSSSSSSSLLLLPISQLENIEREMGPETSCMMLLDIERIATTCRRRLSSSSSSMQWIHYPNTIHYSQSSSSSSSSSDIWRETFRIFSVYGSKRHYPNLIHSFAIVIIIIIIIKEFFLTEKKI